MSPKTSLIPRKRHCCDHLCPIVYIENDHFDITYNFLYDWNLTKYLNCKDKWNLELVLKASSSFYTKHPVQYCVTLSWEIRTNVYISKILYQSETREIIWLKSNLVSNITGMQWIIYVGEMTQKQLCSWKVHLVWVSTQKPISLNLTPFIIIGRDFENLENFWTPWDFQYL